MRKRVRHIHLVGIGGSGMSGIAEVLANLDYRVSGSDIARSSVTERLERAGIEVFIGHHQDNIVGADVVVVSSAIDTANPEIQAAANSQIPVIPRAEMLGELMRFQPGIAVAGTHGKTTTTSLVAAILIAADLDPTFVVGGLINSAGANAKLGKGEYLVAEADESDASFLNLKPEMAIVTNIDEDHMVTYEGDLGTLKRTFVSFLQNLPFYGVAVLCADDENVRSIMPDVHKRVMTYGLSEGVAVRGYGLQQDGLIMRFNVAREGVESDLAVTLPMPGEHNVLNALAAISIATHLRVPDSAILSGLESFGGIGRRFETLGEITLQGKSVLVVDDYAHHPRELSATLAAAEGTWPNRRIVVVFQPHRYSRTSDLFEDFVQSLAAQTALIVTSVYPAGEQEITGATGKALTQAIRVRGATQPVYLDDIETLQETLGHYVEQGDVVLTLGAGNIGRVIRALVANNATGEAVQ